MGQSGNEPPQTMGIIHKKRLTLFAHWDPDSVIDETVVLYLKKINEISDIIFCSDCNLSAVECKKVKPYTIKHEAQRHGEYDFGSYKRAYILAKSLLSDYDELILANDSCYGGFISFQNIFSDMEALNIDYWGIFTHQFKSTTNDDHLQSFFLVFKKQVFMHEKFSSFLVNVKKLDSKNHIIRDYEIGLSKHLEKCGFTRSSLIPPTSSNKAYKSSSINLVITHKLPLIKRDLLAKNPYCDPDIIEQIITANFEGDFLFIMLKHLNRISHGQYAANWFRHKKVRPFIIHRKLLRFKTVVINQRLAVKMKFMGISVPWIKIYVSRKWTHQYILDLITKKLDK